MSDRRPLVTVVGGTGFLGRRIVRQLSDHRFRVRSASRHLPRDEPPFSAPDVETVRADIHDEPSLTRAIEGADGVVNAVSLYVEKGSETFHAVHVEGAARVGRLARQAGISHLVHISGIGSDPGSSSAYIRARGQGEDAVGQAFADAVLVRSSVMFASDDAFLTIITQFARLLPVYPLFGSGETRLQPAYAQDVAEAVARLLHAEAANATAPVFELGGPRTYTYEELVRTVAAQLGARTRPVPLPFALWNLLAATAELVPGAPLTRNQVALMRHDNVASPEMPGFAELEIEPTPVEAVVKKMRRA